MLPPSFYGELVKMCSGREVGTGVAVSGWKTKRSMTMDSENMKTLTVAGVKKLMKERFEFLNLEGLNRLSDEVAEVLGTGVGYLILNGLTELSPRAAAALSRRTGEANPNSKRKPNALILNGLTSISVETAKALARYEGDLILDGLARLPDDVAAALAKFKGENLTLDGLQSISDMGLATLATMKAEGLSLGLARITVAQAKILKAFKGKLSLSVKHLSAEVAAVLGERRGKLYLECLPSLSAGAAEGLARHRGYLSLNGLERIFADAAKKLAKHKGDVVLGGVKKITKEAAKALAKVEGVVRLNSLESMSAGVAIELAKRPDRLDLYGLTRLTNGVAEAIRRRQGHVSLHAVKDLTDKQVEILLPKYAEGTLYFFSRINEGRQTMEEAWEEARNKGLWPFGATGRKSAALGGGRGGAGTVWRAEIDGMMNDIQTRASVCKGIKSDLATGMTELDSVLRGLRGAELILLAGRPSAGKTTLAFEMAANIALGSRGQAPRPVAIFSLEMKVQSVAGRMISRYAHIPEKKALRGKVGGEEYRKLQAAADALRPAPIHVVDTECDVTEVCARARQLKREQDVGFIVVDYLQLVTCVQFETKGFLHEREVICCELKKLAGELEVPVLVVNTTAWGFGAGNPDGRREDPFLNEGITREADVVMVLRSSADGAKGQGDWATSPMIVDMIKNPRGPLGEVRLLSEEVIS